MVVEVGVWEPIALRESGRKVRGRFRKAVSVKLTTSGLTLVLQAGRSHGRFLSRRGAAL